MNKPPAILVTAVPTVPAPPPTPVYQNKWFMIAVAVVLTVMFIVCMYYMFKSSSSPGQTVTVPDLVPASTVTQIASTSCALDSDCGTGRVCGPFMTCVTPPTCWTGGNCQDGDYCRVSGNDCGTEGIYPMTCKKPNPASTSQYGECSR